MGIYIISDFIHSSSVVFEGATINIVFNSKLTHTHQNTTTASLNDIEVLCVNLWQVHHKYEYDCETNRIFSILMPRRVRTRYLCTPLRISDISIAIKR
jgi:hypothetical protein